MGAYAMSAYKPDSMMAKCNPRHGKHVECCLMHFISGSNL